MRWPTTSGRPLQIDRRVETQTSPKDERDTADNIVLLCSGCHREVDKLALLGFTSEARLPRYTRTHLRPWLPYLPTWSGYNQPLRRSTG